MSNPENRTTERFWQRSLTLEGPIILMMTILVLGLVASNLALLSQNRALKKTLHVRTEPAYLLPGQSLPSLRGFDIAGETLTFEPSAVSEKTVLLVFQPNCAWCRENMANWTALLQQADRERFRFLAVSTRDEGVETYLATYPGLATLPVMASPDPDDRLRYRLFDTPQTLVVNPQGIVEETWVGSMGGRLRPEVESYFGVSLPGD